MPAGIPGTDLVHEIRTQFLREIQEALARDRAKTTDEYRMRIRADLVFKRLSDGSVLSQRTVEGLEDFEPAGSLTSAKRAALPEAARDLAHDIVESVVEYWY